MMSATFKYSMSLFLLFLIAVLVNIVPSEKTSLIATSLYQVFETSDIPPGSINILTTKTNELNDTLSQHENIDGIWAFSGSAGIRSSIISGAVFNLKDIGVQKILISIGPIPLKNF